MLYESDGPVETSSLRRASKVEHTSLYCPSYHWVHEDINTRIRSLLLSRSGHCPPRTPHSSDEHGQSRSDSCDTGASFFDYNSATSVSSSVCRDSKTLRIPDIVRKLSPSDQWEMEPDQSTRATPPSMGVGAPLPYSSFSYGRLKVSEEDKPTNSIKGKFRIPKLVFQDKKKQSHDLKSCVEISASIPTNDQELHEDLDCCPPCDPRDSKPSKYVVDHPSLAGPALRVAPSDLACFLSGCPPGQVNCEKHNSRRHSSVTIGSIKNERTIGDDFREISQNIVNKVGSEVGVMKNESPFMSSGPKLESKKFESAVGYIPPRALKPTPVVSPNSSVTSGSMDAFPHAMQSLEMKLDKRNVLPFSTTISTNFSLPGVRAKQKDQPGTSAQGIQPRVSTSPGQERKIEPTSPRKPQFQLESAAPVIASKELVRTKQSNSSLGTEPKPPSINSGASRKSGRSARHALLKPSITESQPVDTGIPVPPVLSGLSDVPEKAITVGFVTAEPLKLTDIEGKGNLDKLKNKAHDDRKPNVMFSLEATDKEPRQTIPEGLRSPVVGHLTNLQKAMDLVDRVRGRILETQEEVIKSRVREKIQAASPMTQLKAGKAHGLADCDEFEIQPQVSIHPPTASAAQVSPISHDRQLALAPSEVTPAQSPVYSLNATYWGFEPFVEHDVQDAIQKAVQNAVHEVALPPRAEKCRSSGAYGRLAGNSLSKAPRKSDEYLKRPPLRNEPILSPQDSELTALMPGKPSKSDTVSQTKCSSQSNRDISPKPTLTQPASASSKDQENEPQKGDDAIETNDIGQHYGNVAGLINTFDTERNFLMSPQGVAEQMVTVPLKINEMSFKHRPNPKKSWKKGPPAGYAAVPTRDSSINRILGPNSVTASSSNAGKFSQKRSFEQLMPTGSRVLRSISSACSLRNISSGEKHQKSVLDCLTSNRIYSPEEKLGHKNTVHWLKSLLSTNDIYETRLTALPSRTRQGQDPHTQIRANTPHANAVTELFLKSITNDIDQSLQVSNPEESKVQREQKLDTSETFAQTINDLEILMNEALFIARQAADTRDPKFVPAELGNTAKFLQSGRANIFRRKDGISSNDSVHESVLNYTDGSESSESDVPENPNKETTKKRHTKMNVIDEPSSKPGWSSAGRVPTPYPPASRLTSLEVLDRIKNPDPRSRSIETNDESLSVKRNPTSNPDGFQTNLYANDDLDQPNTPRFVNLEPFTKAPTRATRTSSAKSPRRLTYLKPVTVPVQDSSPAELEDVSLDLYGDPNGYTHPQPALSPREASVSKVCHKEHLEQNYEKVSSKISAKFVPSKHEVCDYIIEKNYPPIHPRNSSKCLREAAVKCGSASKRSKTMSRRKPGESGHTYDWQDKDYAKLEPYSQPESERFPTVQELIKEDRPVNHSLDGSMATNSEEVDFYTGYGVRNRGGGEASGGRSRGAIELQDIPDPNLPQLNRTDKKRHFSLRGKTHVSLKENQLKGFSLAKTHKRQSIARDWSPGRKRFVAFVACLSTALVGILVGIYAGETPAIQYYIVDLHHYTVLGNVFFFFGLSIPTFLFWPLPLLHGRKPYILGAMSLAMPLLFPQALAVGQFRSPYVPIWRISLIMSRAFMGLCLGFANMNFKSMLTDLFGASLQSTNPHQEHVDEFDVRRHGGGMGIWLGLWTWSALGSIGFGFQIGSTIINTLPPAWGFYISIVIIAFVMLLNVLCPEVRRSAYRRSVAEIIQGEAVSRRLARGEVKMHLVKSGPKWWGEEFHYGIKLSQRMLRQPGFLIMALYVAWVYGQQVLIIVLLGALMSKDYNFKSPMVGLSVMAIPFGALIAIPFQKASLFSRSRRTPPLNDDGTLSKKKIHWSSHMLRRVIFVLCLPLFGIIYTVSASGPPVPFIVPILGAGVIGFLSNLAMAECHGIIMETFDTSDLQPGMTGRPRGSSGDKTAAKRTNYSSFPRVCSAFSITQGFGYIFAAGASGVGGVLTRHLGQQSATGVMAGILLILSVLLLGVLIRFTEVQIIPDSQIDEMNRYQQARRASQQRREAGMDDGEEPWRPVIIGNPHHSTRRMCLLELGSLSRFSEIRIRNKLVDQKSLEAKHPNRNAINSLERKIKEKEAEIVDQIRRSISRSSRGSRRSDRPEQGDLGGHREMLSTGNIYASRQKSERSSRSKKGERRITE